MRSRLGIFNDRNYALYALGNTASLLGMWAQRVGLGWMSWDLSHSASWVGLVSLCQFLPLILFGPLFGGLLDRCNPKRYAILSNGALTIIAGALYVVATLHALTIERLCGFSALLGIASSSYHPVRLSLVSEVAPPGRLSEAIATNSILYNLTRSLGPALAGVTIASVGIAATFAINAISYLALIGALAVIDIHVAPRAPTEGFLKDFVGGVRYAAGHAFIRELILLSIVTSTFGRGVVELLPAFAGGLYQRGSSGLAALTTASGIGAIIGGLLLSRAGNAHWLPSVARRNAMWVGGIVVALGAVPNYWFAIGAVFILGIIGVFCGVGLQVLLQRSIDAPFRGRVLGLWAMCNIAGPGIGGAMIGALAQVFGLRTTTIASGIVCTALAAWIVHRSRGLRAAIENDGDSGFGHVPAIIVCADTKSMARRRLHDRPGSRTLQRLCNVRKPKYTSQPTTLRADNLQMTTLGKSCLSRRGPDTRAPHCSSYKQAFTAVRDNSRRY